MSFIKHNPLDFIGNTPLVYANDILKIEGGANVFAKLEFFNPAKSVKDRVAHAMVADAEERKIINKDTVLIEPTSGNTGIGLAMIAAAKGYRLILTMPETMSLERRKLLKAYGAELALTEGPKGMRGAIQKAKELHEEIKNSIILDQFANPACVDIHRRTTAEEVWKATNGEVDIFISGVGTGATISGVSSVIKQRKSNFQAIAVEPEESPVLSGGSPAPHKIQGIGAGFVPGNFHPDVVDEIFKVSSINAVEIARLMAKNGLFAGISSGATGYAAKQVASRPENKGKNLVFICASFGERYLSSILCDHIKD